MNIVPRNFSPEECIKGGHNLRHGDPMDRNNTLIKSIRAMRKCGTRCPIFLDCPMMPLAISPKVRKERHCLVNLGGEALRRRYIKMFLTGEEGMIAEIKTLIYQYSVDAENMGLAEREKAVRMLMDLFKMIYGEKRVFKREAEPVIIDVTDESIPVDWKVTATRDRGTGRGQYRMREQEIAAVDDAKPDPESLVFSDKLKEILPSHVKADAVALRMESEVLTENVPDDNDGGRPDETGEARLERVDAAATDDRGH